MRFTIVFVIDDEEGNEITEVTSVPFEIGVSRAELAGPDRLEAAKLSVERMKQSGTIPADIPEVVAAAKVYEVCMAAGALVGRALEKNVRVWARSGD